MIKLMILFVFTIYFVRTILLPLFKIYGFSIVHAETGFWITWYTYNEFTFDPNRLQKWPHRKRIICYSKQYKDAF